jgi:hypothetical protein
MPDKAAIMIRNDSAETVRSRTAHCKMDAAAGGEPDRRGGPLRRAAATIAAMVFAACLGGCQAHIITLPSAD